MIAITISSILKIPMPEDHRTFSVNKIVTTVLGILFTVPIMLLYTFGISTWALLGITLFCGLQMACFAISRKCPLTLYQLLFTNFVVLTYQVIKHEGIDSLSAEFIRLMAIIVAILVGALIMNLVKFTPKALSNNSTN
ncbi:hypothetical protein [Shewanella aestuarii]|uniref:hypothetical protein n=1 Tax=Shewanella aestuarii TaxID=1028752 RepID=UPI001ABFAD8C|nr:hypothetical protein [Shewanella aestuarii]